MKILFLIMSITVITLSEAEARPPITRDEFGQIVVGKLRPHEPPQNQNSEFDNGAKLDLPLYSGNGCPNGTIGATLSPDNKTLSVLFDQMTTEAGPTTGASIARKICRLRVPIRVSPGFQVAIVKSDIRGFTSLPELSKTVVKTSHNLSIEKNGGNLQLDKRPFIRETTVEGPADEDLFIGNHIESNQVWSPCGASFSINVGMTITVTASPNVLSDAMAVIDSLDLIGDQKGMDYHLSWRRCSQQNSNPREGGVRPIRRKINEGRERVETTR